MNHTPAQAPFALPLEAFPPFYSDFDGKWCVPIYQRDGLLAFEVNDETEEGAKAKANFLTAALSSHAEGLERLQKIIDDAPHKEGCWHYFGGHCNCWKAAAPRADLSSHAEWQPIETAPKDGNPCLLYLPDADEFYRVQVGYFDLYWRNHLDGQEMTDPSLWKPITPPALRP